MWVYMCILEYVIVHKLYIYISNFHPPQILDLGADHRVEWGQIRKEYKTKNYS